MQLVKWGLSVSDSHCRHLWRCHCTKPLRCRLLQSWLVVVMTNSTYREFHFKVNFGEKKTNWKITLIRLKCVPAQANLAWRLCFQSSCYKTSDNWVAPKVVLRQEGVKIRMLSNIMEPLRFNVLLNPLFCSIPFRPTTFFRGEIMELGICSPCERRVRRRQHGGSRYVTRVF